MREAGHEVSVEFDIADSVTEEAIALWQPALVIAPFLKRRIPPAVWQRVPCWVVHPGPPGDGGPSSLDWAVLRGLGHWGVTVLQATDKLDGGPVWAWRGFALRPGASKSSLYRHELTAAAVEAVMAALAAFAADSARPPRQPAWPHGPTGWQPLIRQPERAIDWAADDTATTQRKIASADGAPGAVGALAGAPWRLFDAHPATPATVAAYRARQVEPGSLLARRGPAVLVAMRDAALWIGHLRSLGRDAEDALKRPAVDALDAAAAALPEAAVPLLRPAAEWDEVRLDLLGPPGAQVAWLEVEAHNGAWSDRQCARVLTALAEVQASPATVLVLAGGADFFCNGIHLHAIEAAAHRSGDSAADASWRNIEAMDDVVLALLTMTDRLTVAALRGNAGAGGCFVALACDEAWAHGGVVLNPHYKNMGNLYGSEYWTHTLPRRVGAEAAAALMQRRWPTGAGQAVREGLLDACLTGDGSGFTAAAHSRALALAAAPGLADRLRDKAARRAADEAARPLAAYRADELARMRRNFYGFDPSYHVARHHFVHRKPQAWTPRHLALHRGP